MKKSKKGFTLIELLVVIAIIGILSAITVVSLNSARAKGRDSKRISDVKQMQLALALYYDACGRQYPTPVSGKLPVGGNQGCSGGTTVGSFLNPVPVPPTTPSGQSYTYTVSGSPATSFTIAATLENGNNMPTDDLDGTGCADPIYCVSD